MKTNLRSILSLVLILVLMCGLLFLTIGSFHFWQGWVFWGVIGVCSLLITIYMLKFNQSVIGELMKSAPTDKTQRNQRTLTILAILFFVGLIVVPGLDHRYQWSHVPLAVSLVADRLLVLAFFIIFRTFRENRNTNGVDAETKEPKVITTGPYRLVRHPMYTGALLMLLFAPLALASWVVLPFSLPLIVIIVVRALEEEQFLHANLSGYTEYSQKVRYRLIPLIW
ncbi:MAG: isoprenylcysteine carboxylmethyltransferase family protein [Anaerolineaceae bacterium]